jgi:hypothetical protein
MDRGALSAAGLARRRFLEAASVAGVAAVVPQAVLAADADFIPNPAGGYRFLPAGAVFNSGAVPLPGHEIVHVLFNPWVPLDRAWNVIETALKNAGRPREALCGMELRIPRQLTFEGFRAFNAPYVEQLRRWRLVFGDYSAVSRTNVAPLAPPSAPSVHAFSYAAKSDERASTFCVSGTADIDPEGKIIAQGDRSREGMRQKLQYVVGVITDRLGKLGLSWKDATHTDLCLAQDIGDLLDTLVMPGMQGAGARGLRVHLARPPIIDAEVELETRGVRRELVMSA